MTYFHICCYTFIRFKFYVAQMVVIISKNTNIDTTSSLAFYHCLKSILKARM